MWMMGCSHATESLNSRKLRPLVPRPTLLSTSCSSGRRSASSTVTTSALCFNHRVHDSKGGDGGEGDSRSVTALPKHPGGAPAVAEQRKREGSSHPVSSRWNPTPEQLRTLEDLYRRGLRTPSAEQIQHITAQLGRYGKIEGKNVFYWFQNHKARERQKRRRQIEAALALERNGESYEVMRCKEQGTSRTQGLLNNWSPTNCSLHAEESASTKGQTARERWLLKSDLQQGSSAWHLLEFPSLPHLLDPSPNPIQSSSNFITPISGNLQLIADDCARPHTLELFPIRSNGATPATPTKSPSALSPPRACYFTPHQFFQFL